ncbi:MAG: nitroreductase family protein [Symbiobacterium sp.]|uniref:nitroreductase family protein n=1 Tax=Symbiobacterium sp. TaxID=1971213 RepID=UPI003464183F
MNEILQSLHSRKSVRVYEERPVEPEKKRAILEAALQAPTAGNMTLYSVIDVTDPQLKETLAITCDHQPFIAQAPLVLIFCADYSRWFQVFQATNPETRRPSYGDFLLACCDALIAAQNAVVAAEALGLGSCYIGDILERYEEHKALLGLPKYVAPVTMLCVGYPTEQQRRRAKPPRFRVEDIVHANRYQSRDMAAMVAARQGLEGAELERWLDAFRRRKWEADFSVEMSRSVRAMLADWTSP